MKKVVQGVLCDTTTARLVGEFQHSNRNDFHFYREELYRTKSGKYFIHGEGHAASPYARKVAQSEWAPGEAIKLLPPEAARQWAEDHLDAGEYIAAFGEPEEMSSVLIAEETKGKLVELKRKTGKDIDRLIADAIGRYGP